jgi:hypothetical protein
MLDNTASGSDSSVAMLCLAARTDHQPGGASAKSSLSGAAVSALREFPVAAAAPSGSPDTGSTAVFGSSSISFTLGCTSWSIIACATRASSSAGMPRASSSASSSDVVGGVGDM